MRDLSVTDRAAPGGESGSGGRLVVVGNGMVGQRFVELLSERDLAGRWAVTVLAEESRPAYDRVGLSRYFQGATGSDLTLVPDGFYASERRELRLGDPVVAIDRAARTVRTAAGTVAGYDALVLATGSAPFVPPLPGADLPGCFDYRTLDGLDRLRAYATGRRTGVVVGGGLLGLEAAGALRALGLSVQVVEVAPRLMPRQVDEGGGAALRRLIEKLGVTVHSGVPVERVCTGPDGSATGLVRTDGTRIDAEVVVFAAGVRPRDELARGCGLAVGERGGVVVDDSCHTADPAVWAIGECAAIGGMCHGLVAPGYAMAEVVADRLTGGGTVAFPGADTATQLKLLDVGVASFGDAHASTPGALEVVYADPVAGLYKKLVVTDDARELLGGVLVGDTSAYPVLRTLLGRPLPQTPEQLLLPAGAGPAPEVAGDAQVCSCHAVRAGEITAAIAEHGLTDLAGVKACTRAGTGCGSCVPLVKSILDKELAAAGVAVSKALCEHFDHGRAELFDIVRVRGITTFSALIGEYGRGLGCDLCKPVVASILASLGRGHVLDGEQAGLQDTNDHFLANLQRNGTYSVVPRVPGGEISPEKLIVLGEVAKEFGLYTKITGGQRIDLFGARVEQLPAIWQRLVGAGFESGHAYGKAVRTVKSCVGSTWCRYGVQDSVGLAIALELRYRGLRAPHKIKAAVSGCARECAEARGKDFGVIATEQGWNLYLGGNGGFRPRHADLFAENVDTDTLITYIDRFLMYYIRTADRLQRTAPWLEEHGLDHVREVIVDDTLGLCAELDAAMARHVDTYEDEWRATLNDPDKLRRFVSFVNAPGVPDPDISFAPERDQIRPVLVAGPQLEVRR